MGSPPKSIVTGVAGFIGSHLAERLLQEGHRVLGIDSFLDSYPRALKEANLESLGSHPFFSFFEGNLLELDLEEVLEGADYLFHQAALAGVRTSWGKSFKDYLDNNVLSTQCLLEAVRDGIKGIKRIVYASSSSIYGDLKELPLKEECQPQPHSPYGVTKLAGEHLCQLYHRNYGLPVVSLRYFTVYGPRQRPDMAFHRFICSLLLGTPLRIYGDGEQTRDFTYVSDAVEANLLALKEGVEGMVFNIGGGSRISLNDAIKVLERITGRQSRTIYDRPQKGDVRHTFADTSRARTILGFSPKIPLEEGLLKEVEWIETALASGMIQG